MDIAFKCNKHMLKLTKFAFIYIFVISTKAYRNDRVKASFNQRTTNHIHKASKTPKAPKDEFFNDLTFNFQLIKYHFNFLTHFKV